MNYEGSSGSEEGLTRESRDAPATMGKKKRISRRDAKPPREEGEEGLPTEHEEEWEEPRKAPKGKSGVGGFSRRLLIPIRMVLGGFGKPRIPGKKKMF